MYCCAASVRSVQKWDAVLPTGYHSVGVIRCDKKVKNTWDGSAGQQSCDIVKQLEKLSHGYGTEGCNKLS